MNLDTTSPTSLPTEPAAAGPSIELPATPPTAQDEAETQEQMLQKKAILDDLNDGLTELMTGLKDKAVAAIALEAGYEPAEIQTGLDLLKDASLSVGVRFEDLGKKTLTQSEFAAARELGRAKYVRFRRKARIVHPSEDANQAMALRGRLPDAFDLLVTLASQSYSAGSKAPYAEKLAKRGYPKEKLQALTEELDALLDKESERNSAKGNAQQATAERNAAYAAYREFIVEFRGLVRIEMEDHPGAKAKMGW